MSTGYLGPALGTARARRNLVKAVSARFPPGTAFDPAECGDLTPDLCKDVYRELLTFAVAEGTNQGRNHEENQVCIFYGSFSS